MFRRTNAHFHDEGLSNPGTNNQYKQEWIDLINGENHEVYLGLRPLLCFYGSETKGYPVMSSDDYFLFYELRAAAVDVKIKKTTMNETMKRILAQFRTLVERGIRHVVLSAFGCGAFGNDPKIMAYAYKIAIQTYGHHFDCIAFGIYDLPFSKVENYPVFKSIFESDTPSKLNIDVV